MSFVDETSNAQTGQQKNNVFVLLVQTVRLIFVSLFSGEKIQKTEIEEVMQ